jgi:hypothetical protein
VGVGIKIAKMENEVLNHVPAFYLAIPYFLLLILANWLGFIYKNRMIKRNPDMEPAGLGTAEGSLLGLTALLLSFSFGMSASKFDYRRQLIVEETNDIGTTILRCDLYPDSIRNLFRADLKNYLESRIAYYDAGDDPVRIQQTLNQADSISGICWRRAASLARNPVNYVATLQMVPSLNATIDIVTTREVSRKSVVPRLILRILSILTLVSAFLSGYGSKSHERNKVLVVAFALMTTLALYLVIDLDRPRQGYINLNNIEQHLVNLRSNF